MGWAFSVSLTAVNMAMVWLIVRSNRRTRQMGRETQHNLAQVGAGVDLRITVDGGELVSTDSWVLHYLGKYGGAADAAGWTDILSGTCFPVHAPGVRVLVRPRQLVPPVEDA